jgi:hypothetical protein
MTTPGGFPRAVFDAVVGGMIVIVAGIRSATPDSLAA